MSSYDASYDFERDQLDYDGAALCPFKVEAVGFPAVTSDGRTVVSFVAETLSSSDGEDEVDTVRWRDVESRTETALVIVDGGDDWPNHDRCRELWKHARAQAEVANARFATTSWNPMSRIPMVLEDPNEAQFGDDDDDARLVSAGPCFCYAETRFDAVALSERGFEEIAKRNGAVES